MFSDPVPPTTAAADPAVVPTSVATDASATPGSPPAKTPLDILEEILGKDPTAPGASGLDAAAGNTPPADPTQPPPEPEPPKLTPEQIDAIEAERKVRDAAALAAKQAEMSQILQTPQYQAKVAQENAADVQEQQHEAAMDGFEIVQLSHTKIPDPNQPQPS